jgi:hypothetical protein
MKRKLIILSTLLLGILACGVVTPTPSPEPAAESAQVDVAPEVEEVAPEPTATFTPEPEPQEETTEEIPSCLELLTPLDKADLPAEGKVVFSWTTHSEADSYSLNFVFPDGLELNFAADETTKNRYMDGFSMHPAYNQSGEHQWNVSALNAAGEEICQSEFFTFTKPALGNTSQDNGGGDGACVDLSCASGGGGYD